MAFNYSNTKIFEQNTKGEKAITINKKLWDMYELFYQHIKEEAKRHTNFSSDKYNGIQLLTCFDSYINKTNKIMCFGKEANTNAGELFHFSENYQNDIWYSYEYAIAHINDESIYIPKKDCPQTFYLKTRKAISGFDEKATAEIREKQILSILNNNLNKTSFNGKRPEWNEQLSKIIYSEYDFDNFSGNIFLHELNILRPTHLVFISGKGYTAEIKRAFGEEFLSRIFPLLSCLKLPKKGNNQLPVPVSEPLTLRKEEIENLWGIKNYSSLNIIYAFHPSAHLSKARDRYIEELCSFVTQL